MVHLTNHFPQKNKNLRVDKTEGGRNQNLMNIPLFSYSSPKKTPMKVILIIIAVLGGHIWLLAQTHRFIYGYQYKRDSATEHYRKTDMVLDVNPKDIKFYEYQNLVNDSINKKGGRSYSWNNTPTLKRERNTFRNTTYTMMKDYFSVNSEDKMDWKLLNETKKSGEYTLQKATTNFGGRTWIAWFCKEINLEEGPYKFRGLPGLIFELADAQNNFIFTLTKSEKLPKTYDTTDFLENFAGKKPVAVNQKVLNKMQLEFYNDPLREIREKFDENPPGTFSVSGTKVTSKDQLKVLTEKMQEFLRKMNNPLELTTAVVYPNDVKIKL